MATQGLLIEAGRRAHASQGKLGNDYLDRRFFKSGTLIR